METPDDSAVLSGRIFWGGIPDTSCLANFQLSLRDEVVSISNPVGNYGNGQ